MHISWCGQSIYFILFKRSDHLFWGCYMLQAQCPCFRPFIRRDSGMAEPIRSTDVTAFVNVLQGSRHHKDYARALPTIEPTCLSHPPVHFPRTTLTPQSSSCRTSNLLWTDFDATPIHTFDFSYHADQPPHCDIRPEPYLVHPSPVLDPLRHWTPFLPMWRTANHCAFAYMSHHGGDRNA
jgi:hypothetical protein